MTYIMLPRALCSLFMSIFKDEKSTMLLISRLIDDLNLKGILCCRLSFAHSCTLPTSMALSMCNIKLVCLIFPLWSCSPGLGLATAWCWHPRAYSMFSVLLLSLVVPTCHRTQQSWGPPWAAPRSSWAHRPVPVLPWATSAGTLNLREAKSEPWWFYPGREKRELAFNFLMSESASQPCWTAGCSSEMPFALQIGGIAPPQKH